MDLNGRELQKLEGPFTHHVYIGFSQKDKQDVFYLRTQLENEGVICLLQLRNEIVTSIREGVRVSQKVLLFLSPEYEKDDRYRIETEAALEKVDRFCRDTLIIMKSSSQQEVPEKLKGFKEIVFDRTKLKVEKEIAKLVDVIVTEPNVQLTVLPKLNIGYGAALGYFYGFLRLTLPEFKRRLIDETLKYEPTLVPKTIKKMLIIMPESCFCATEIDSCPEIAFTGKFVVRVGNRAGNKQRDYKSSLYKLTDRKEEYYFVGELATPLLTMYETYSNGLCNMTKDQLYAERDAFYYTLKAVLSHPDNAECNDQFRVLYWSDPETDKTNQLSLSQFLLPVLKEELAAESRIDSSKEKAPNAIKTRLPNRQRSTFEPVEVSGSNPSSIYEQVEKYPMNRRPRGMCLIINITNFDKGHNHLTQRRGSERDTEVLKELFEDLHFMVQVHVDIKYETLETLFLTAYMADHSNYDAFVCCILTHGKLGVIYTSDGKPVEILSLVEYFTDRNCPSLKGKPKMFFIQACQRGDTEPANDAGRSLPHDGFSGAPLARNPSSELIGVQLSRIHLNSSVEEDATSAPNVTIIDEPIPVKHKSVLVPGSPDFLMSYSTLPGSISYRDTQTGSLYIQELDKCMRQGQEMDRVLKTVSKQVKLRLAEHGERDGDTNRFQLPFHLTSGMDRLIFL